eukprot:CAMPEP_0176413696 /NCGR_PEP_ID=MMETSP0127-20121128/4846_1 /TAXON_ID=938130 /ORGANISM="Platyophrya macrostoma, Strain WH" /LENGTH=861 /DNA_ID=CAMNT_0017793513 /DNA_START=49 /DNA_END=2630 /DNA_ORIENTATION=+
MSVTDIMVALGSTDPQVRNPAEAMVNQAKESDLAGFLVALIHELRDESKPSQARQMAGVVLKNSVALHLRDVEAREALEKKWTMLPATVRSTVKSEVLATLGSSSREVRQIAANIIGNLSRIELPANEWPELITTLVGAAQSENELHTEAALTALGYICEEASEYESVEQYLAQFSTPILSAVGSGMNKANEDIKYYATNALCNSMEFIHANMNQQEQRDYLVKIVCTAATTCQSDRTREKAMECLVKVADLYYDTLPAYIVELHSITTNAIFNDKESVALQALLFWTSICETEHDLVDNGEEEKCLGFAARGGGELCDLCLKCLVRQEEGQTEEDWNLSIAGGKLLQALAACIGNNIQSFVMPFVYANINSNNWRQCEGALMAFGCILSGPSAESIQDTVAQAIPGLLQYVRHSHELVADTSGWVLGVVCELFPDVFLDVPTNLQQLLNIIGPMISAGTEMSKRACTCVHNLALAYEDEEDQTSNELSPYYTDIVRALLTAIDNQSVQRLQEVAQETLNVVVDAAAADCFQVLLHNVVPEIHRRLGALLQQRMSTKNATTQDDIDHLIGLMCGALGGVAKKLGINMLQHVPATVDLMEGVFRQQTDTVQSEALIVVGALAQAVQGNFAQFVPRVMPYIVMALQMVDQEDLCHAAAGTLGDCATALQEHFAPYAESPLVCIRDSLTNPNVDRDVKCSLLGCLGDVALSIGAQGFLPYLATFAQIVGTMYEESKKINFKGDYDSEEYVMGLWESISSFYTGLCQCFNTDVRALTPYLQSILVFALEVCHAVPKNDFEDVLAGAIGVIGDLANILAGADQDLRMNGKNSLLTTQVREIIREALRRKSETISDQAKWAGKQLTA